MIKYIKTKFIFIREIRVPIYFEMICSINREN